jgi:DNA-binding NtrC family response regulator
MPFTVLIVDDELKICLTLSEILRRKGFRTLYCTDPREVIPVVRGNSIDLLLVDVKMPEQDGIDLLRAVKMEMSSLPVIMISGHATVDRVVVAMKYGALNFYTKPINNQKLVDEIAQIAAAKRKARLPEAGPTIVTRHPAMLRLLQFARKAAPTDATVTITGESGTGKELIADLLHHHSPRRYSPFIKINCAAIPETLLESEMFGHEKGAFTDAKALKQGKFELAGEGSIFLDEIGDMSLQIQAKMLRVLQDKCFTRIGGSTALKADCRIIAATNKKLQELIDKGLLREDLYYRLSVITLQLPPLRDRKEDIPLLSDHFLREFNHLYGKQIGSISDEVISLLERHDWPGNVRELKNFMERAVIFCEGKRIEPAVIPEQYRLLGSARQEAPLDIRYQTSAREIIVEALQKSRGIKQKAAKLLRIDRKTLYRKMKKYKIDM